MSRQMQIVRAVALAADGFYEEAKGFGETAADCFAGERSSIGGRRSQITGLESLANSSIKVSDILDYIKKQVGKIPDKSGRQPWREHDFGKKLLEYLEINLKRQLGALSLSPPTVDKAEQQRVHLMLIREFVRQMSAHYEYYRSGR
jgi:hypothetical protein